MNKIILHVIISLNFKLLEFHTLCEGESESLWSGGWFAQLYYVVKALLMV